MSLNVKRDIWVLALKESVYSNDAVNAVNACMHALSIGYGFDINEAREILNAYSWTSKTHGRRELHVATEMPSIRPLKSPPRPNLNYCRECRSCLSNVDPMMYDEFENGSLICFQCRQ